MFRSTPLRFELFQYNAECRFMDIDSDVVDITLVINGNGEVPDQLRPVIRQINIHSDFIFVFIPNFIPNSVTSILIFDDDGSAFDPYDHRIHFDQVLPDSVTYLRFPILKDVSWRTNNYTLPKNLIPLTRNIKELDLGTMALDGKVEDFPPCLTNLTLSQQYSPSKAITKLKDLMYLQRLSINFNRLYKIDSAFFPKTLESLTMTIYQEIYNGLLPPNLVELKLINPEPIEMGSFPASLTKLKLFKFNQPLVPGFLPPQLKSLSLELNSQILPNNLQVLKTGDSFDQQLDVNVLPSSLTSLIFGPLFSFPIKRGVLPESITDLNLGSSFNHEIGVGVLPSKLLRLDLGYDYNQPIKANTLPPKLSVLFISPFYNQPLEPNVLPPSIKQLALGQLFDYPLEQGSLPPSLTYLVLPLNYNQPIKPNVIPNTVTHLGFSHSSNPAPDLHIIPTGVKTLIFSNINYNSPIEKGFIPSTVTKISINFSYTQSLIPPNTLPNSIKTLTFYRKPKERLLPSVLPSSLTRLNLYYSDNNDTSQLITPESLPITLKSLCVTPPFLSKNLFKFPIIIK
ncbi:hypothetical protein CYY_000985 [Polysphondylium violaceum]|uniref:FNIP repeat-containing protein n=1 Tax=Polysphondylium violaceum TaxID=133409 RepID=A0A8J4Q0L7_9MYCE|nr:hypothetical protein CYY_000985 [Polysphondylium violaceum]